MLYLGPEVGGELVGPAALCEELVAKELGAGGTVVGIQTKGPLIKRELKGGERNKERGRGGREGMERGKMWVEGRRGREGKMVRRRENVRERECKGWGGGGGMGAVESRSAE